MNNRGYLLITLLGMVTVAASRWLPSDDQQLTKTGDELRRQEIAVDDATKADFTRTMANAIAAVSAQLLVQKRYIIRLRQQVAAGTPLTTTNRQWLSRFAVHVGLSPIVEDGDEQWWQALEERVDVVPAELLLAQAALNSNWGQRPEASLKHRYFALACAPALCTEQQRDSQFTTIEAAVAAHIQQINSDPAYALLRHLRSQIRVAGREPNSEELLPGLLTVTDNQASDITSLRRIMAEQQQFLLTTPPA